MLKVAIVEDMKEDADLLEKNLRKYEAETGTAIEFNVFDNVQVFLLNYQPVYDVVFMDIMMPYLDGMKAAAELRKQDECVPLIFVTDMAKYAINGYEVGALDFFVKPVTYPALKLRLDRISMMRERSTPPVKIHIPYKGTKILPSGDVYYIEVMNKEMTYHTRRGDFTVRSEGLKKLESELKDAGFMRCSSSYLINLKWCTGFKGDLICVAGDEIKISRRQKKEFISALSLTYLGGKGGGRQ